MLKTTKKTQRDGSTVEYVTTPIRLVENDRLVAPAGRLVPRDVYERIAGQDAPEDAEDAASAPEADDEGDTAPAEPADHTGESQQPEPPDVSDYHTGAGWYELPDGERIRGKKAAAKHLVTIEENK